MIIISFENVSFTTIEQCKEDCKDTDGCVAFTTRADDNLCYLKSTEHADSVVDPYAISAHLICYRG